MFAIRLAALEWMALCLATAHAQTNPTLVQTATGYVLRIPYLEFSPGGTKAAYSAKASSTNLGTFSADSGSVASVATQAGVANTATLQSGSSGYVLNFPWVDVDGQTQAYSASLASTNLSQWTMVAGSVASVGTSNTLAAPTGVVVSSPTTQTVGSLTFGSSGKLAVRWSAPGGYAVHHYEVIATEAIGGTRTSVNANAGDTGATLAPLKAATPYRVMVRACQDSGCTQYGAAAPVSASTATEYWQLQGSGASVSGLTKIVSDGNARLSATRIGPDAGTANAGKVQLYYGPAGSPSLSVAVGNAVATVGSPSSYLGFSSRAGVSGLASPPSSSSPRSIASIATGQGVPLAANLGNKVRVFFEATGSDNRSRIFSIDSQDGFVGQDFNSGSATTCSTDADYASTGGCAPTLAIGVEGDSSGANARITHARQNKVAYPSQSDWRWNGAAGALMVFTTDNVSGCSSYQHNHGYAVWDGARWNVQYRADGCPKLFTSAQACLPMHLGGARYKMYCGDPSITNGKVGGSSLPFLGPKKLFYADGSGSGADATVEFEDWEAQSASRDVVFLWPDGTQLDDRAEGYIDDYHFLAPTGSLDVQAGYLTITDGTVVPFAVGAVLLNP
ncbi:MAG: fibronectin type III domain-containing protein [Rhodoferax sp.]